MTIQGIRFRNEGALVVLQVLEETRRMRTYAYEDAATMTWRDATTEDLLGVSAFTSGNQAGLEKEVEGLRQGVQSLEARVDQLSSNAHARLNSQNW